MRTLARGSASIFVAAFTAVLAVALGTVATAAEQTTRIRGEIVSLNGDELTVQRRTGDNVTVTLGSAAPISAVRKLAVSDIKQGQFIGTAAKPNAQGQLTAQEVVVFPESQRGTGEGHYAWDLGSNSTMTNANVDAIVESTSGNELRLSYKGGSKTVTVPPNVPIVAFIPATRADLLAQKQVFIIAAEPSPDKLVAQRVVVEKNGVVPPM